MWKMIQLKARLKRLAKARQDRDEYSRQMRPGMTPWQFGTLEGKLESAMDEIDRHWAWFEANGFGDLVRGYDIASGYESTNTP